MSSDAELLWQYLDENRGSASVHELLWQALASEPEIKVTPELLREVSYRFGSRLFDSYLSSPDLAAFIGEIAAIREPNSVLDPTCGSGLLLKTVADRVNASTVHGVEINKTTADIAKRLLGEKAEVIVADVLHDEIPLNKSYDLIVSEPPFGFRMRDSLVIEGLSSELKGDFSDVLACWTCTKISKDGMAVLILPASFIWSQRSQNARKAIGALGCAVTGCIQIPPGAFQGTGIEAYVVVIERGKQGEVFVGQYTTDNVHQRVLVANFAERKEGSYPAQGRLCAWEEFRGYTALEAADRVQQLVKGLGFDPIPMSKMVIQAIRTSRSSFKRLEHKPNSVYIPSIGRGKATVSQDDLPKNLKDYIQLELDPRVANARFVAEVFNRELGQAIIDTIRTGTMIGRIHPRELMSLTFFLPPVEMQTKILEAVEKAHAIRNEIDEMEEAIWTNPQNLDQLEKRLAEIGREDQFADWIETLPFPLASILWRYKASAGSTKERYEILLHFFEALAEFIATIHLSAFSSDIEVWNKYKVGLQKALVKQKLTLKHSSFGAWRCIAEFLGSRCRKLMNEELEICINLYRTHNPDTINMLGSSELLQVLQKANKLRNDWKGHSGAVGEEQAQSIHSELWSLVQSCRQVFGRRWQYYELVQPGEARFHRDVFRYKVKRMVGTRSMPFETVERETIEAMDEGALYVLDVNSDRGLRLLPFVRVMPSPQTETNACYFYNRLQGEQCRYISYHFAQDPDVTSNFADTREALTRLGLEEDLLGGASA